jgi:hypothetical protein
MWSDATTRRNPQAERRVFEDTQNTFGCRFYHGIAVGSACERDLKVWLVRLTVFAKPNDNVRRKRAEANQVKRVPLANARYVVTAGETKDAAIIRGTTTDDGVLKEQVHAQAASRPNTTFFTADSTLIARGLDWVVDARR